MAVSFTFKSGRLLSMLTKMTVSIVLDFFIFLNADQKHVYPALVLMFTVTVRIPRFTIKMILQIKYRIDLTLNNIFISCFEIFIYIKN